MKGNFKVCLMDDKQVEKDIREDKTSSRRKKRGVQEIDFDVLRQRIFAATRQAFDQVKAEHPHETFYAFALYCVGDGIGLTPSASSEQAYERKRTERLADEAFVDDFDGDKKELNACLLGDYRWSAFDWEYECVGAERWKPALELDGGRRTQTRHGPARSAKFSEAYECDVAADSELVCRSLAPTGSDVLPVRGGGYDAAAADLCRFARGERFANRHAENALANADARDRPSAGGRYGARARRRVSLWRRGSP